MKDGIEYVAFAERLSQSTYNRARKFFVPRSGYAQPPTTQVAELAEWQRGLLWTLLGSRPKSKVCDAWLRNEIEQCIDPSIGSLADKVLKCTKSEVVDIVLGSLDCTSKLINVLLDSGTTSDDKTGIQLAQQLDKTNDDDSLPELLAAAVCNYDWSVAYERLLALTKENMALIEDNILAMMVLQLIKSRIGFDRKMEHLKHFAENGVDVGATHWVEALKNGELQVATYLIDRNEYQSSEVKSVWVGEVVSICYPNLVETEVFLAQLQGFGYPVLGQLLKLAARPAVVQ